MLGLRFCGLLLRSTGSRRAGSVIVAHGPSCSAACGIFPDQGSNPCSLHWQADSQPLRHQGSRPFIYLFIHLHRRALMDSYFMGYNVSFIFYKFIFYLFIYFWLHWVFVAACRLSLVTVSRGYSSLRCAGFSLRWLLL